MHKLKSLLEKFPHLYTKFEDSNLGKVLSVFSDELTEIENTKSEVELQDNLSYATGETLDRHGEIVGQDRRGLGDNKYRKYIETRVIANLSGGDIPTINKVFNLILKDNFLGVREGWNCERYDSEPALIVVDYIHEIIEGGISPTEPIKLNSSTFLDGEYSLDGRPVEYYESEIINFAKQLAKRVIAGGVRVFWETPVYMTSEQEIIQDVDLEISNSVETQEIATLDGSHNLEGSIMLDSDRVFTDHKATLSIYESGSLTEEVSI